MRVTTNVPLADLTTLRLGGPARRLVEVDTEAGLVTAVRDADAAGEPLLVLGGGSNVVVADEGFDGTVIRVATRGVQVDASASCETEEIAVNVRITSEKISTVSMAVPKTDSVLPAVAPTYSAVPPISTWVRGA